MHRQGRRRGGCAAVLATALAACAPGEAPTTTAAPAADGPLRLAFEDVLAPAAFRREGPAVAEPAGAAPGFWAVAPGLPRPERALVERPDTGARIEVALFAGRGGPGGAVRLSPAAAEALGIGAGAVAVRVTALRREPRIARP